MRRAAFLVGIFVLSISTVRADFEFTHGEHTYLFVTTGRTWGAAGVDAASRSLNGVLGHLAIIESAAENTAIFNAILANFPSSRFNETRAPDGGNGVFAWIAATDRVTEGAWRWDGNGDGAGDGVQFYAGQGNAGGMPVGGAYHNWGRFNNGPWEPDNGASGLQDAGGIGLANWPRGFAGEWNDVRVDNSLYYVVEFAVIPEPSLALLSILPACMLRRGEQPRRRAVRT